MAALRVSSPRWTREARAWARLNVSLMMAWLSPLMAADLSSFPRRVLCRLGLRFDFPATQSTRAAMKSPGLTFSSVYPTRALACFVTRVFTPRTWKKMEARG